MSDLEDFDITKSIGFEDSGSESEFDSNESFTGGDDELQDEILSDNEEKSLTAFPSMELSDDDDDDTSRKGPKNDDEQDIASYFAAPDTKKASTGTFAGLGLGKVLKNNIARKGFKKPTPIQRRAIPLALDGKDLVGMARTGSGKTAAFVLPMLERLKVHSAKIGARALIMAPSREVALQTLKVVKEFSKGTDLRTVLLVGGDSLEDQFGFMMTNPDIIIATPGRFLHLKVEMQLDLKSIEYVVFDEADQLFELGFAEQLDEILASLSTSRQTLLFSATLPASLFEFAKAGLTDPVLVRLDAETKVSEDLEMAFFSIKDGEREAALCAVLQDVIKMPPMSEEQRKYLEQSDNRHMAELDEEDEDDDDDQDKSKKKKPKFKRERMPKVNEVPTPESTILFVPTKHHVEYYVQFLKDMGYAVSYSYSNLHQTARREQLWRFNAGKTSIFVVTDIAARGLDIPLLANVINLNLPSNPKVFVHRAGRTARAGQRGWAYSLVREAEMPYLMDLELFLGRKLLLSSQTKASSDDIDYRNRLVLGSLPQDAMEMLGESTTAVVKRNYDLDQLRQVAARGEKQYLKSIQSASRESVKRAKTLIQAGNWNATHVLFGQDETNQAAEDLLARLANRRNRETVFEFKKTSMEDSAALMMAKRRSQLAPIQERAAKAKAKQKENIEQEEATASGSINDQRSEIFRNKEDTVSEDQLNAAFKDADQVLESSKKKRKRDFRDERFFMSHYSTNDGASDRGYSVNSGFAESGRSAAFNLADDGKDNVQKQGMKWDKKKGKYVNAGSTDGVKYIRGENGNKIPASLRSGRFDKWKAAHKASSLKVGALEQANAAGAKAYSKFKYDSVAAPKKADKARNDYHKQKKKVDAAMEKGMEIEGMRSNHVAKTGIQSTSDVRKARDLKQKRREKNARPTRRKKK